MRRVSPGLVVALALAAAGLCPPALAADMAAPAAGYYPPVAPAVYDWTGIYFGGNVGAGLIDDVFSQAAAAPPTVVTSPTTVTRAGVVGGAQIGINYQVSSWVVGAEASWAATTITGSAIAPATAAAIPGTTGERSTSAPLWYATATGRVGYALNTLLLYVKGGGAVMDATYTQDILVGGFTNTTQSISDNRTGFTVGLGLEYGMTENLSAKFEYDFLDFGTKTYQFNQTPVSIRSYLNTMVVGLNYRFDWAGGWH